MIPAATEKKIEMYSGEFYAACTVCGRRYAVALILLWFQLQDVSLTSVCRSEAS